MNLGVLMCIECLGIYRYLGVYLFRVRFFDFDDWLFELLVVMIAMGNALVNSVWEGVLDGYVKLGFDVCR